MGLPVEYFHGQNMGPIDDATRAYVEPLIQRAALVASFNEAWIFFGAIFLFSLISVFFLRGGTWKPGQTRAEVE